MSEILAIQSLGSSTVDASRLALQLGIPSYEIVQHCFPDCELRVTIGPATPTTIVYASLDRPNDKLVALLFAAEALRRGGCKRIVLLAPYLCYMRQDSAFLAGEAISQRAIGRLLAGLFDRIITVDAHLHRTSDIAAVFPGIESVNLSAVPAIADALRAASIDPATVVIGPDSEAQPWIAALAARVGLCHAVARKSRRGDRTVEISFDVPSLLVGRPALIFDDVVSTGGTVIACARALVAAGASSVDVVVTHALFPDALNREIAQAGIRSIRSTYSVPHPTNAIILDDLYVEALRTETRDRNS